MSKVRGEEAWNQRKFALPKAFLGQEDFEALFDSYDVLGIQTIPIAFLLQGMSVVGINNGIGILQSRY
eukprot:CAMPEP_0202959328 /NCGR_PEP_ID=MMETSP1396-20130829/3541_1 /ASSEMBLY_ACC=CAM_ASM_000872 /TAXON_ID= /ORGANISM="Pseudokeronopsis sp., Strain Brazil" /LENGTH=67 /DNA_ID=CAMNT_0049677835 /DNA_START=179 /DNA_END=382 /DNA_ORIENTATION=+